jgi:molecular chaperone GrpE
MDETARVLIRVSAMTEYEEQTDQPQAESAPDASHQPQEGAEAPAQAGEGAEAAGEAPELTLEQLQQERDDLEERLKRVSADYQNYQRRAQQNVTTAREQQLMDVAKSLVTVLDHFDHALQVDPQTTSPEKMMEGVQMVQNELLRVLNQHGVQRVDAEVGEAFDPNRHEAMMKQPTSEIEPDHVAAQIQPGYALKDKTIRPAKVTVAEAPSSDQPAEEAEA